MDSKILAEHAMENVDPQFFQKVKAGDLIVGGTNFGCGSSREQAPIALKALGISCVVANTFARILYRNSFNIGFPVNECPGLHGRVKDGDTITVDLAAGHVVLATGETVAFPRYPANILEVLQAGGGARRIPGNCGARFMLARHAAARPSSVGPRTSADVDHDRLEL